VTLSLEQIAAALNGEIRGDQVLCAGPGHSATDRSLSVKISNDGNDIIVHSFSPADSDMECKRWARMKLKLPALANGSHRFSEADIERAVFMAAGAAAVPKRKIVAVFDYKDRDGTLLYQTVKFEPKDFRQRRPGGNGGWIWKLEDRRVLYRWGELLQYSDAVVHFTEGEKDSDAIAALDLCATTIASGKWTDELVEALKDRNVWIFEDQDKNGAGRKRALEAAERLHGVATSIKIIRLPGLTGETGSKDVTNWLVNMGHSKDELYEACASTPDWEPEAAADQDGQKPAPPETKTAESKSAGALSYFSDLVEAKPKLWLIKNVIARGECSSWIGPPGKGKSALLADISAHGAHAAAWRDYRIKENFGVLYFALERVDLVKRRMTAHRMRDDLPADLPIAIYGQVIDLMSRTCVRDIINIIDRSEDRFGREIGLVLFDTYAKGIAAGGGDESLAKDQNAALANLRRVLDRKNIHIATIGHTGKDESKGERGSNAKLADVDLQVQISGDTIKSATVKKANDQQEGLLTSFHLEPFEFGPDEDGDPFRTFILSLEIISDAVAIERPLTGQQQRAIEALIEVTLSHSVDLPPRDGMPAGLKSVTADQRRAELYRRGVLDPTTKNPRARFFELRNRLAAKHLIGVQDELVWLATKQKQ
jgi:hypothetical protein